MTIDDLRATIDEVEAIVDNLDERARAFRLRRGIADQPEPTIDELRAETTRRRAENDQAAAALREGRSA